jgi:hypothetical protein
MNFFFGKETNQMQLSKPSRIYPPITLEEGEARVRRLSELLRSEHAKTAVAILERLEHRDADLDRQYEAMLAKIQTKVVIVDPPDGRIRTEGPFRGVGTGSAGTGGNALITSNNRGYRKSLECIRHAKLKLEKPIASLRMAISNPVPQETPSQQLQKLIDLGEIPADIDRFLSELAETIPVAKDIWEVVAAPEFPEFDESSEPGVSETAHRRITAKPAFDDRLSHKRSRDW